LAPCALEGWSRRHLVSHFARNADAVGNLLAWARTGRGKEISAGEVPWMRVRESWIHAVDLAASTPDVRPPKPPAWF
jgi:hypothetical protein